MAFKFINHNEIVIDKTRIVTNPDVIDSNGKFTDDGIYSKRIFGSIHEISYSCDCGDTNGRFTFGTICPKCKTKVSENDNSMKTGWILLNNAFIMNPLLYILIGKIIPMKDVLFDGKEKKYYGIGMDAFKENFDEILKHFSKPGKKEDIIEFINDNRDNIFTDKVFVSGISIRPAKVMNGKFTYDKLNDFYSNILKNNTLLIKKGLVDKMRQNLIFEMQVKYNEAADYQIELLSGKSGVIRDLLLGYRVNFSSRSVIAPGGSDQGINDIHIPYVTFMEVYKYHLIHLMKTHWGYDYIQAINRVTKAKRKFDSKLLEFGSRKLLVERVTKLALNRNPSISVMSMLTLRVVKVHEDMEDFTFSISNQILTGMGGDYDGDTLSGFHLIDNKFIDFFDPLSPTNLIVDTNTGKLNTAFSVDRDVVIGLTSFMK